MGSVLARSVAATLAVIAIWSFLANRNPDLTYHFAPVIGAVTGPWLVQSTLGRQPAGRTAAAVATSIALVLITGFALHASDRLLGPTFWSPDGAIVEVVLFALAGGVIAGVLLIDRSVAPVEVDASTDI